MKLHETNNKSYIGGEQGGGKLGVVLARLDNQLDSPTDNGLGDITLTNF